MARIIPFIIAVIIVSVGFYFLNSENEVVTFNETLVNATNQHFEVQLDQQLFHQVDNWLKTKKVDPKKFTTSLGIVQNDYRALQDKVKTVNVPDYPECQAFHDALTDFVENAGKIIEVYAEISVELPKKNQGSFMKRTDVAGRLLKLKIKQGKYQTAFKEAQDAMAKRFDFKIQ